MDEDQFQEMIPDGYEWGTLSNLHAGFNVNWYSHVQLGQGQE